MYSVSRSDEDEEEDLIRNLVLQEESPPKTSTSKLQKQGEIAEFADMNSEESSSEHLETFVVKSEGSSNLNKPDNSIVDTKNENINEDNLTLTSGFKGVEIEDRNARTSKLVRQAEIEDMEGFEEDMLMELVLAEEAMDQNRELLQHVDHLVKSKCEPGQIETIDSNISRDNPAVLPVINENTTEKTGSIADPAKPDTEDSESSDDNDDSYEDLMMALVLTDQKSTKSNSENTGPMDIDNGSNNALLHGDEASKNIFKKKVIKVDDAPSAQAESLDFNTEIDMKNVEDNPQLQNNEKKCDENSQKEEPIIEFTDMFKSSSADTEGLNSNKEEEIKNREDNLIQINEQKSEVNCEKEESIIEFTDIFKTSNSVPVLDLEPENSFNFRAKMSYSIKSGNELSENETISNVSYDPNSDENTEDTFCMKKFVVDMNTVSIYSAPDETFHQTTEKDGDTIDLNNVLPHLTPEPLNHSCDNQDVKDYLIKDYLKLESSEESLYPSDEDAPSPNANDKFYNYKMTDRNETSPNPNNNSYNYNIAEDDACLITNENTTSLHSKHSDNKMTSTKNVNNEIFDSDHDKFKKIVLITKDLKLIEETEIITPITEETVYLTDKNKTNFAGQVKKVQGDDDFDYAFFDESVPFESLEDNEASKLKDIFDHEIKEVKEIKEGLSVLSLTLNSMNDDR